MKDLFEKIDKKRMELANVDAERSDKLQGEVKLLVDFTKKLQAFLKPYEAEFEARNFDVTEKIEDYSYSFEVRNRESKVEIAVIPSQVGFAFECVAFINGTKDWFMMPKIENGFVQSEMEIFVYKSFSNLI